MMDYKLPPTTTRPAIRSATVVVVPAVRHLAAHVLESILQAASVVHGLDPGMAAE
jgi:hypothetical protein